ncbi:MAG: bphE3 [Marmoricola sp.]|jgi:2-keto-4-pentenoate hydratase|nr:bphE3 [Marmoricola sp.]
MTPSRRTSISTGQVADGRLDEAAQRLLNAARSGVPCAPVRDLIGRDDIDAAYAVQQRVIATATVAGATVIGRKIGLTSAVVQAQLGVDRPDFGVLLHDMQREESTPVAITDLLQPRIEAEVAFVLGADLYEGPLDVDAVRAAVAHAVAALEIVDSRIAGWDISFGDTVADNASSGLFVLGTTTRSLEEVDPVSVQMTMSENGEEVSTGNGAACLGDPLEALAWLARTARDFGEPLRAGQVILSGALGPMVPVKPGATYTAALTGLGQVSATFTAHDQEPHA